MVEHLFCNQVMAVRFCHGAPSLFLGSTVGSCAALLMPMSEVRAFPGEPVLLVY